MCCAAAAVTLALLADAPQEGDAAGDGATDAPARGSVLAEERVLGVRHRLRDQEIRQMLSLIAGGSAPWAVPAADGLAVLQKIALCVDDAYAPCLCRATLPCTSGALLSCLLPMAMRFCRVRRHTRFAFCVFSYVLLMCVWHDQGGVAPVMRVLLAQMDMQEAELLAIERSLLQHTV